MIPKLNTRSILSVFLLSLLLLTSCGKKEDSGTKNDQVDENQLVDESKFADWKTYTYQDIKIIYPEGHPFEDDLHSMANGYINARQQICAVFKIEIPTDTLRIYYYTGFGQGREMTGSEYVFSEGNSIHYWAPSYLGVGLMQYLMPQWRDHEPQFKFLESGLMALFDFSGNDYHEATLNFKDENKLVPLVTLAVDTMVNIHAERYQSGEAASFIAFFLDTYGWLALDSMYYAKDDFETTVKRHFKLSAEQLQENWLKYADSVYNVKFQNMK